MLLLVDFDARFLKKSWHWLNDPEIKALTLTPAFTKEMQTIFYSDLPQRNDYWIKGILENEMLIGAMGLKNINLKEKCAEYWGYIGEKQYWGKGTGKFMIREAFAHAKELGLSQLYLKVGSDNLRAKKLYLNSGFTLFQQGELEQYMITI